MHGGKEICTLGLDGKNLLKETIWSNQLQMSGNKNGWDSIGHGCTNFSKNLEVTLKL